MKTQALKHWLCSAALPVLVVLAIFAFIFYALFDNSEMDKSIEISANAIENYLANPTKENAHVALDKFESCDSIYGVWSCGGKEKKKFIQLLVETAHIDIVFQAVSDESEFHRPFEDYLERSAVMTAYTGQLPDALTLKANAFSRQAKVSKALPIYKELFDRGERWEVATSLRSLFTYYGCTDDVKIWGEFTAGSIENDAQPSGSPYPEQPQTLSSDEIIDNRIRLQKGEFVQPSKKCPIILLLSEAESTKQGS